MLTLKKVKELVEAPSHAKRTPSPKMLFEEGIVLLRREFDQGSHLTVYNSGYVLFSAGKKASLKAIDKEIVKLEAKKTKADAKAAEEAKKAEAETVLKKLLAEGMSADEILEKLK